MKASAVKRHRIRGPKLNAFFIGGAPEIAKRFCLLRMAKAVFRLGAAWRAVLQAAAARGNATAKAILDRYPDAPLGRGESPKTVGQFTDEEMSVCVYASKLRSLDRDGSNKVLAGEVAALEQRINARIHPVSSVARSGASSAPQSAAPPSKASAASAPAPKPKSVAELYAEIPENDHVARSRFYRAHKAEIQEYLREQARAERAGPGLSEEELGAALSFASIPKGDHRARARFCRENRAAVRGIINQSRGR